MSNVILPPQVQSIDEMSREAIAQFLGGGRRPAAPVGPPDPNRTTAGRSPTTALWPAAPTHQPYNGPPVPARGQPEDTQLGAALGGNSVFAGLDDYSQVFGGPSNESRAKKQTFANALSAGQNTKK